MRKQGKILYKKCEKNKIIPIEVKSSGYKTHKSLDVFTKKYSGRILKRYLVYTKDMSKE